MSDEARPAPRAVVFDLDGTLVDSRQDIANAMSRTLAAHGLPARSDAEIVSHVGDGARSLIARCARLASDDARLDRLLATFLDVYAAHPIDHTRVLPGALEAFAALRPLPLAVCTNKPRRTTDAVLGGLGLARELAVVVAGDDLPERKPHPLPLLHVASALGVPPTALVMVGDGPQDVECGRAVGARTVGVEGGILPRERLIAARPDAMIGSLWELAELVARWS